MFPAGPTGSGYVPYRAERSDQGRGRQGLAYPAQDRRLVAGRAVFDRSVPVAREQGRSRPSDGRCIG
jgi:hypothetical protein